jgi:F-type H+-transporting ATPase subunit epsilon
MLKKWALTSDKGVNMAELNNSSSAGSLHISVVSPSGSLYEGEAVSVTLPAHDGQMGILPGHAPLMGLLGTGLLVCKSADGSTEEFIVEDGFMEVGPHKVTVLANNALRRSEVDFSANEEDLRTSLKHKALGDEAINAHMSRLQSLRVRKHYGTKQS